MRNTDKKNEGTKKKNQRPSATNSLTTLEGKDVDKMTDKELRQFVGALGKLMDVLDDKGKVKPL
jgi:hypothetical protein